jgi:hypothetical protein
MHCSLYWLILFSNNSLGCGTLMYGVLAVVNEGRGRGRERFKFGPGVGEVIGKGQETRWMASN